MSNSRAKGLRTGMQDEFLIGKNRCHKIKATFNCITTPEVSTAKLTLTLHWLTTFRAQSPCGWQTKKSDYTCMAETTPPHFLTGETSNEPQHMRQASDLNVEWMLQRGTRQETRATCNRGVWLPQQRSTINSSAIQTGTRSCVVKRHGIGAKTIHRLPLTHT